MAVDPASIAAIANAARTIMADEESRQKVLLLILAPVIVFLLILTLAFYLLTLPFGWLGEMFLGDEYDLVEQLRDGEGYAAIYEPYYDYMDGFNTWRGYSLLLETNLFGITDKVKKAIDRLRMFEPPEGYYLAFSGGKDSQTIYHLAKMAGARFDAHYNHTTVDPPELIYFMREHYPDVIVNFPKLRM